MQQLNLITSSNKTIMYDQYCKMLIGHPYILARIISCFVEEAKHLSLDEIKKLIKGVRIGDKIVLFKDGRRKKLKSYWIDKKVPQSQRGKIPLLCADNEIAAIIGDRVAENYKVKKSTQRGLLISYGSKNENR